MKSGAVVGIMEETSWLPALWTAVQKSGISTGEWSISSGDERNHSIMMFMIYIRTITLMIFYCMLLMI